MNNAWFDSGANGIFISYESAFVGLKKGGKGRYVRFVLSPLQSRLGFVVGSRGTDGCR